MIRSPAGFDGEDRIKRYLDYYQPSYGAMMLSAGQFSPSQLFAQGEQGVWYDPSDLSTLFQDVAGTTPVTAVEQAVGLMLDKRNGLGIGTELVSNNTFASDTVWTRGSGWTIGSGVATKTSGATSALSQTITLAAGVSYRIVYTITRTSGSLTPRFTGGTTVSGTSRNASGTYVDVLAAVSGNITFGLLADASFAGTVDNVYVKRVSGNDAFQTTSTARPIYRVTANGLPYLAFDGTDDSLSTGTINPGSVNKAQVFAGVRKLSDAAAGILVEHGPNGNLSNGGFYISAPETGAQYGTRTNGFGSGGGFNHATFTAPITNVISVAFDTAGSGGTPANCVFANFNGARNTVNPVGTIGAGNYTSQQLFIGSRGGSTLPFNGQLYSLIVRFSATNLPDATIAQAETWVNGKTGAY